jgi:hypothetical protein
MRRRAPRAEFVDREPAPVARYWPNAPGHEVSTAWQLAGGVDEMGEELDEPELM